MYVLQTFNIHVNSVKKSERENGCAAVTRTKIYFLRERKSGKDKPAIARNCFNIEHYNILRRLLETGVRFVRVILYILFMSV